MGKIINTVALTTAGCLTAANVYLMIKGHKKNMLDVLIEEIETIK